MSSDFPLVEINCKVFLLFIKHFSIKRILLERKYTLSNFLLLQTLSNWENIDSPYDGSPNVVLPTMVRLQWLFAYSDSPNHC